MGDNLSVEEHNEEVFRSLKPGDIVKFHRGAYRHFALYIGQGQVIHLTAPANGRGISGNIRSRHVTSVASVPVDKAVVAEDDFFFVAGHDRAYKANREEWPSFDIDLVLRKAKQKLGNKEYHLLTSNCEHFVNEIKYGRNQSNQIKVNNNSVNLKSLTSHFNIITVTMGSGYSVDEHNQNLLQHLIPGDVVSFNRGSFTEYAIFVGNSKVIPIYCSTLYYAATDLKAMTLDFMKFANGDKAEIDNTGRYDLLVEDFIESYNKAFVDQLHQGDLVKFHKRFYTHWAVYVGNRMVVHMAGNVKNLALQKADVVELSLKRAADGSMAFLGNEMDGQWKPLPAAHIVKRARAQLGEVYYNILCHNCEHFAKWCRYNRDRSGQAEKYFPKRMCQLLVLTGDYREPVTYTQTDGGDYVYSSSACPIF